MKLRLLLVPTLCLVACSLSISAQVSKISEKVFWSKLNHARTVARRGNYRETTKTEIFRGDNKPVSTSVRVVEGQLPDGLRIVDTQTLAGVTSRNELIFIGGKTYCRKDSENWGIESCKVTDTRPFSLEPDKKRFSAQLTTLYSEKATLYVQYSTNKSDLRNVLVSDEDFRYWLNEDGRILREETVERYLPSTDIIKRTTVEYGYDPKDLKIEAPIK